MYAWPVNCDLAQVDWLYHRLTHLAGPLSGKALLVMSSDWYFAHSQSSCCPQLFIHYISWPSQQPSIIHGVILILSKTTKFCWGYYCEFCNYSVINFARNTADTIGVLQWARIPQNKVIQRRKMVLVLP